MAVTYSVTLTPDPGCKQLGILIGMKNGISHPFALAFQRGLDAVHSIDEIVVGKGRV